MVVIVDPHLKRVSSYPVYQEASERGLLVKPKGGNGEYEGWCWSGSSSWTDFFNPGAWEWWKKLFKTQALESGWSWTQSTDAVHIWNDMNEVGVVFLPSTYRIQMVFSLRYSMGLRLQCQKTTSTMVVGSIVMSITSMACFS